MRISLLDHGYLELVEHWGSDERIIEAARMSTQKGFEGWGEELCANCGVANRAGGCPEHPHGSGPCNMQFKPGDERLLRYLYEHKHSTPFEMAGLVVEVQAPIFVFREWHRHRTQSYNEMSARYAPLPDLNYMPTLERFALSGGPSRQAKGLDGKVLDVKTAHLAQQAIKRVYDAAQVEYIAMLESGVPKELARLVLPVGRYSRMRASANLRNWLAFLTLRQAPQAQWEIRQYADALSGIVKELFPRTHALFAEGGEHR
jgi:thymidylate synthase (FAD)